MSSKQFIIMIEERKSWFSMQCALQGTMGTGDLDCQKPEPLWWQGLRTVGTEAPKATLRGEREGMRFPRTYSFILKESNILVSTFL